MKQYCRASTSVSCLRVEKEEGGHFKSSLAQSAWHRACTHRSEEDCWQEPRSEHESSLTLTSTWKICRHEIMHESTPSFRKGLTWTRNMAIMPNRPPTAMEPAASHMALPV
eukprot:1159041-Pelagomonas_calceolata.AAC.6